MAAVAEGRRLIWRIVALAALLRLPTAFYEMFHHPDEVWQYLEPAYGTVTGRWVVMWEYRAGMRSWLIPTMLAAPMWLGKALAPGGALYLILTRLELVALSLGIVGFGAAIALRISRLHAMVAGLVLATSFELIYFSARALSETVAIAFFMPALWLLLPHTGRDRRALLVGGLLLGLAVACRLQLAPAAAALAIGCCGRDARAWGLVVAGGLGGLAIDGVVDALHGLVPLAWMVENVRLNLAENRSAHYGVSPPQYYLVAYLRIWGVAALPMLALALWGARRQPVLLAVALVTIAVHSLIGHKEYRFVLLATVLLLLLAGLGTADLLGRFRRRRAGALAALFWAGCSVATATSAGGREQWSGGRGQISLWRAAHGVARACGLAFFQPDPDRRVAYVYYDRATPIYFLDEADAADAVRRYGAAFNMVVTSPDRAWVLGSAYRQLRCRSAKPGPDGLPSLDGNCLYVRPGGCGGAMPPHYAVNATMAREQR